jgi:hypothetical protein
MSVISNSGQPVTWQVISQQEVTGQDGNGDYVQGVRVTFQLSTGTTGSVFIPDRLYNEQVVADRITMAAIRMANVDNLSGELI